MTPMQISDYYILPLVLPKLASFSTPATHFLYLRPHDPKIPDPTTPRSLFLVNVPIDATEVHIKELFSTQLGLPNGRIQDIQFEGAKRASTSLDVESITAQVSQHIKGKKRKRGVDVEDHAQLLEVNMPRTWDREVHKSGSHAVVVFVDRASLEATLKAVKRTLKSQKIIQWGQGLEEKLPPLGSNRYLRHYQLTHPDKAELLESVNSYMTAYAAKEAARVKLLARQRQVPDEDGFITVTRGGRIGPARQEEAQEKAEKQREKQKGLEDFYRFQTREKRKERAGELIKKFEEDKQKVKKMREQRGKFRPEK